MYSFRMFRMLGRMVIGRTFHVFLIISVCQTKVEDDIWRFLFLSNVVDDFCRDAANL